MRTINASCDELLQVPSIRDTRPETVLEFLCSANNQLVSDAPGCRSRSCCPLQLSGRTPVTTTPPCCHQFDAVRRRGDGSPRRPAGDESPRLSGCARWCPGLGISKHPGIGNVLTKEAIRTAGSRDVGRQGVIVIVNIHCPGKLELPEIVAAGDGLRLGLCLGECWQEQGRQDGNDADNR